MVDLGQAITRPATPSVQYRWEQVKVYAHQRGTKCVIRQSNGSPEALAVEPQADWKEWVGVFSML